MKKQVIFLKVFEGESLENVIDYWAMMNNKKIDGLSVTENVAIKNSISRIKEELERPKSSSGYLSIKELMNK